LQLDDRPDGPDGGELAPPDDAPDGGAEAPVKPRKRTRTPSKPKRPPAITVDQYNALWRAYRERPDVAAAAKSAGVPVARARWYCEGPGWPEVGFRPLVDRLRAVQTAVARIEDTGHAKWRAAQLEVVNGGLDVTGAALELNKIGLQEIESAVKSGDLKAGEIVASKDSPLNLPKVAAAHDKLVRTALLLMGEPDSAPVAIVGPGHLNFAEWTAEECEAYYRRGVIPERERNP